MFKTLLLSAQSAVVGMLITVSAAAEPVAWLDVGVKGGAGGNYQNTPDNLPPIAEFATLPFDDGAGGVGGGGGLFVEGRFLGQHLGLEIGFLADRNKNWCTITHNDVVEIDYIVRHTSLRIPIMLQGAMVKGITRIGLGVGPEIIVGLAAEPDLEIVDGDEYVTDADLQSFRDTFSASTRTDVALAWEFALAFAIKKVSITFDFRFAYLLTYPDNYSDRVKFSQVGDVVEADVQAGHTIDARLLLGAAYTFDFGSR